MWEVWTMPRTKINRNISILTECYKQYNTNFHRKWTQTSSKVSRIEYSNNNYTNYLGYYSESLLRELTLDNFNKGKIFKTPIEKYTYKYHFDENNRIIITEIKYPEFTIPEVFFYIYKDRLVIMLGYGIGPNRPLEHIIRNEYDENGRMIHHLVSRFSCSEPSSVEEQLFKYTSSTMSVYSAFYVPRDLTEDDEIHWDHFVFPIEWSNGKPYRKPTPISSKTIARRFFENIKRYIDRNIENWKKKKPYAIMFLLDSPQTMAIDYGLDNPENPVLKEEGRWNYSCWKQHASPFWENEKEINQFVSWLEMTRPIESSDRLIDHDPFIDLFVKVINDLRASDFLKNYQLDKVLLLVTNFELYNRIIDINRTINNEHSIENYLAWCNSLR